MGQGQSTGANTFSVPYETAFSPAIGYGTQVHVSGNATGDRFEVNLANQNGDIVLHVNPRLNDGVLILNSAPAGQWGAEERTPLNNSNNGQFDIIIMLTQQAFKVAVNNQYVADYKHRLPFTQATLLTIKGDVNLTNVQILPGFTTGAEPWRFVMEQAVPINVYPGRVLYIDGRAGSNAARFEFNLLTGTGPNSDVVFHFNPRFDQREVVRNSSQGGVWGTEEKDGEFPVEAGQDFEIQIICFPEYYQVNCNGQPLFTFRHRLPYQSVQALQVKGDVLITNVRAL